VSGPRITAADEWRGEDGFSRLVITRDFDGRVCFGVHDAEKPGFAASFDAETSRQIAAFINGGR
jgi:hypothetical protein